MDAYIDYNNFCSYVRSLNREKEDSNKFLRNRLDLKFTFSKDQLDALKEEERFNIWLKQYTDDAGKAEDASFEFDCQLSRPLNEEEFFAPADKSRLSAIYMLEGDEVQAIKDKGGLLVAPVGEELETLERVMIRYKDGDNETQYSDDRISKTFSARAFKDWRHLECNEMPCTDIIIADRYFFSQKNYADLKNNVFPLLKILMSQANGLDVNLVIFAEKTIKDKQCGTEFPIPLGRIYEDIQGLSNVKPNVTFVDIHDNRIHGREIISNYLTIVSSNSFGAYFLPSRAEKGVADTISLFSVVHPDVGQALREEDIEELQKIIDCGMYTVYGDGKSNFFTFSENSLTEIRPLRTPIIGEIIQLHRDNGDNVCWEDAVTEHERFNDTSSEDFEVTRFEILDYTYNTNSKTKSQYPYFIYVKKLE